MMKRNWAVACKVQGSIEKWFLKKSVQSQNGFSLKSVKMKIDKSPIEKRFNSKLAEEQIGSFCKFCWTVYFCRCGTNKMTAFFSSDYAIVPFLIEYLYLFLLFKE